jgi:filamentous hemagglutinin family protein
MYQQQYLFRPGIVALLTLFAHSLLAGVVFDGSLGKSGPAPFANPNFTIPASFGTRRGGNLFHSFSQFNLIYPQSAAFTGPPNVHNILARVTSGCPSSIDGIISSDIQGANLFFLNPAGVMFGEHAKINVSGSFAVSTANYLKLADGGKFNTSLGGGDMLTSAPVTAFGFLKAPRQVSFTETSLFSIPPPISHIAPEKSFSVVAGDITMSGGQIRGEGSRVNLVSVKSAGEAKLDATALATDLHSAIDVTQFTAMGKIDIKSKARIISAQDRTSGLGGPVFIRAGKFLLENNSLINSTSVDSVDGSLNQVSKIDVRAHDVEILGSRVAAPTFGTADAGQIMIAADSLLIDGQGNNTTGLLALAVNPPSGPPVSGNGGQITVTAAKVELTNGGEIGAFGAGTGGGGTINICAHDSLLIDGKGVIGSGVSAGIFADAGSGKGGDITVKAGDVEIINGGEISTGAFGINASGTINVIADSILIDGTGSKDGLIPDNNNGVSVFHGTGILALGYESGNGGSIDVHARGLSIVGGGQIAAATFGTGNGGTVTVTATGSLLIDGTNSMDTPLPNSSFGHPIFFDTGIFAGAEKIGSIGKGGDVTVKAGEAKISASGEISSDTFSLGQGGTIEMIAHSLLIDGKGLGSRLTGILASAEAGSGGNGGNLTVDVKGGDAKIANGGQIAASTFGTGDGGSVIVNADDLSLQTEGAISAASFTSGQAGSVQLKHVGTLSMDSHSSISSANTGGGNGGSVTINTTGPVTVKDGSSISTDSTRGNAGDITLSSGGEIKLKDHSTITGSAGGSGGNISITTPDLLYLLDSEISAVAFLGGGNFEIDSQFIVLNNSLISTNAPSGQGGNQNLNSDFLFKSNSLIIATGTINITAPALDLGAQLITLPTSLLSAANQLQERCTALLQEDFSSFISIGRGGTEPAPEELQTTF